MQPSFNVASFYNRFQLHGIQYGPAFRGVKEIWNKNNESLGKIVLPTSLQDSLEVYQLHPALLDACLQVIAANQSVSFNGDIYLPAGCDHIRYFSKPCTVVWSHIRIRTESLLSSNSFIADIRLSDENDHTVAELVGFRFQRIHTNNRRASLQQNTWLYDLHWQVSNMPFSADPPFHQERHWLIFSDDDGLGEALATQLEGVGDHCHILPCTTINDLDTENDSALLQLIDTKLQSLPSLYGVIHFWSLSMPSSASQIAKHADMYGCNGVLYLLQALTKRVSVFPRLWLVTKGAQYVKKGETISVEQSTLWGFGKVVSFEFPELKCIRIDLESNQSIDDSISLLFKQLALDDKEDMIAFRSGTRYVQRLSSLTLAEHANAPLIFHEDATYMITGGGGALGLATARWMAEKGAKHLVLLGRNKPNASAMNVIKKMERVGVEVAFEQADVSDAFQLEKSFRKSWNKQCPGASRNNTCSRAFWMMVLFST
jgi:myxalamid-type polyketide synthase MxaE and MxaD